MPEIVVNGETIPVSEAGWLEDTKTWNEDIAKAIAERESVQMSQAHWDVVREARAYYEEYGICAEPRVFAKLMKEKYGAERSSQQYIYELFPYGLIKQGNKIAGLPRPKGCS
ncbi:TusE/DsrC/DsvC family sulfur relay protein [Magnetospirillum sp. UT-4]|uniref:TusE/DsrC/DsvC family sulfur relay protein n=1 Tax=Magnetospirillum sp. UT-4 TaxID=2681467 RepID=UPI00137F5BB3|nr:TusE/DsrC/DsvC family sulfur relay protein [Magnetospirillum sp. UT-4]CAA7613238.1 Sulfurtransferase TusE [Magnetospirillum sp. UT-4]